MKNSNGNPGFNLPVNIGESMDLSPTLLKSARNCIIDLSGELPAAAEKELARAIIILDHLGKILEEQGEYYEKMRGKIELLTKKLGNNEKSK